MSKIRAVSKDWAHSVCTQVHVSLSEGLSGSPGSTGRVQRTGESPFEGSLPGGRGQQPHRAPRCTHEEAEAGEQMSQHMWNPPPSLRQATQGTGPGSSPCLKARPPTPRTRMTMSEPQMPASA